LNENSSLISTSSIKSQYLHSISPFSAWMCIGSLLSFA